MQSISVEAGVLIHSHAIVLLSQETFFGGANSRKSDTSTDG